MIRTVNIIKIYKRELDEMIAVDTIALNFVSMEITERCARTFENIPQRLMGT